MKHKPLRRFAPPPLMFAVNPVLTLEAHIDCPRGGKA